MVELKVLINKWAEMFTDGVPAHIVLQKFYYATHCACILVRGAVELGEET